MNYFAEKSEEAVAIGLKNSGWRIVERNFRRPGSEIDIIACKGDTLVFIEVKYRQSKPAGLSDVSSLLPYRKKLALQRGARAFLDGTVEFEKFCWRFDLVLTWKGPTSRMEYEYYPNAFEYFDTKNPT